MAISTIGTSSISALGYGFKNRIINGAMMIDQRSAGASVTPTTDGQYTIDRFAVQISQSSKFSVRQNAGSVTPPEGFVKYLGATSLSTYSVTSTDYFNIGQLIEGLNFFDFGWGTANAQPVTISFKVYSSLTGTFGAVLGNGAQTRNYPFSYTINTANTWTTVSVTIAGDTSGTWVSDNTKAAWLKFSLGTGSTRQGTSGVWSSSLYLGVTGETSVVGTNGATFYITGVQLEKGSTATSFDYRPYGTELALCQRYYEVLVAAAAGGSYFGVVSTTYGTSNFWAAWVYKQQKRAAPTFALASGSSWGGSTPTSYSAVDQCLFNSTSAFYSVSAASAATLTAAAEL